MRFEAILIGRNGFMYMLSTNKSANKYLQIPSADFGIIIMLFVKLSS